MKWPWTVLRAAGRVSIIRFRHPDARKKAASSNPGTGTTRARSRESLRISQEVSAMSAQPWQAAPCSHRRSMLAPGACRAQSGSLEQSAPRVQRIGEMGLEVAGLPDQPAEGAFGVGGSRVEKEAEALTLRSGLRVDPLADGARRHVPRPAAPGSRPSLAGRSLHGVRSLELK